MNGKELLSAVEDAIMAAKGTKSITTGALAEELGISVATLTNWKARETWTPKQVAQLLAKRSEAVKNSAFDGAIATIVEFLELNCTESRQGAKWEIFPAEGRYLEGLKQKLQESRGVYIFYDSRGRAIYAGKTEAQTLWTEINLAFNRDRDVQKISIVDHPSTLGEFKPANERQRQIRRRSVRLYDLATYISVYEVHPDLIAKVEALLVRGFANDLQNVKMEHFTAG